MAKRLLVALLCACTGCFVWAHDFSVPMQGYSLYYNVLNTADEEVEVTSPNETGSARWMGFAEPTGRVNIPEEVVYRGITYKVTAIADRAFAGCSKITGVDLPATLKTIGAYAFGQCFALKGTITIGEKMESIGNSAFYGCGISEVVFNAEACDIMGESIGNTVFSNCHSLKKITFGDNVARIPAYAFAGLDKLKFQWELPAKLEYIGDYAFAYCSSIYGKLDLPEGVRQIGENAFLHCHLVSEIEMPAGLAVIGVRAFSQCLNVKTITVNALIPPEVGLDAFLGLKGNVQFNVPCISVDRYKAHEVWRNFRNIKTMAPCTIRIDGKTNPVDCGTIVGRGDYKYGDSVTLIAVCYSGFGFLKWSDGVTQNPRRVYVSDTASYTAIMQPADVLHEVEYVHDTVWAEGAEVVREYYEINDVAEPIYTQEKVSYNGNKHRVEFDVDKNDLVEVALYNDVGVCVKTGKPRSGHIKMRRFPTGYYVVRVTSISEERVLRFFHDRTK